MPAFYRDEDDLDCGYLDSLSNAASFARMPGSVASGEATMKVYPPKMVGDGKADTQTPPTH